MKELLKYLEANRANGNVPTVIVKITSHILVYGCMASAKSYTRPSVGQGFIWS